jgi:hypothetical protein
VRRPPTRIDLSRCDWCGFPLAASVDKGCIAENCSMRPMPELTERGVLRQEIRYLLAVLEEIGAAGVDADSGIPFTGETLGGLSKQRLAGIIQDLTEKARDAAEGLRHG